MFIREIKKFLFIFFLMISCAAPSDEKEEYSWSGPFRSNADSQFKQEQAVSDTESVSNGYLDMLYWVFIPSEGEKVCNIEILQFDFAYDMKESTLTDDNIYLESLVEGEKESNILVKVPVIINIEGTSSISIKPQKKLDTGRYKITITDSVAGFDDKKPQGNFSYWFENMNECN